MTPWTWIGVWRREDKPDWPDPRDLADPSWDPDERSLVATYLEKGAGTPSVMVRISPDGTVDAGEYCQLCEGDELISFDNLTDGTYVWPEGLAHYVEVHSVRLPSPVVDHILQQQPFDFDAIAARVSDEIHNEGMWFSREHDRGAWWRDATSQAAG